MLFTLGQLWISDIENGLGLGTVVAQDTRMVTLLFSTSGENRLYARSDAPITRVMFNPGEIHCALREVLLDSKLTFSKPQDRLFAGQIDRMDRFALRYRARKFYSKQFRAAWNGLRGIRASLIPHQVHIAAEVGQHMRRAYCGGRGGIEKNHLSRHDNPSATADRHAGAAGHAQPFHLSAPAAG